MNATFRVARPRTTDLVFTNMSNASVTAPHHPWKRAALLSLLALAAVLIVAEFTRLDVWISDHFYDANSGGWLVKHSGRAKAVFYNRPLQVIKLFGAVVLVALLVPHRWVAPRWRFPKREIAVVFLALTLIPSLVGSLKAWTGMFCPRQLVRYGGTRPVVGLLEHAPENCCGGSKKRGRCWPAGHASGGFALMSLWVLGRTRAQKVTGLAIGFTMGWTMGLYQMLNGNHYLSHTLVTMLLAWLVIVLLRAAIGPFDEGCATPAWRWLRRKFPAAKTA